MMMMLAMCEWAGECDYEDDYDEKTTMMKRATMIKMTTMMRMLTMMKAVYGRAGASHASGNRSVGGRHSATLLQPV